MKPELLHFLWGFWCGCAFMLLIFGTVHFHLERLRKALEKAFRDHVTKIGEDIKERIKQEELREPKNTV